MTSERHAIADAGSAGKAQWVLLVLAVLYTLYFARTFLLPVVVALILAMALHPCIRGLRKFHIPRHIGALLVLLPTLLIIGYSTTQIYHPAMDWLSKAPASLNEAQYRMREWIRPVQEVSKAAEEVQKITEPPSSEQNPEVVIKKPSVQNALFEGTQSLLGYLAIIVFLVYFLLASGDTLLMNWIDHIFRPKDRHFSSSIIQQTERYISRYLFTITCINIGLGVLIGSVMFIFGMPSPFLWGAMAAILNFVPYVGAVTGMGVTGVVAILSLEPVSYALLVPLAYLIISGLEGIVLTPIILGRSFALHPVVIFIWLIFMGWIWGIPGALLAVPTLTIIKIVSDHSKRLEPISRIIGRGHEKRHVPASLA